MRHEQQGEGFRATEATLGERSELCTLANRGLTCLPGGPHPEQKRGDPHLKVAASAAGVY